MITNHGAGRLYLWRRNRDARELLEGKKGHAAHEAAVPGERGAGRLPVDGQQR